MPGTGGGGGGGADCAWTVTAPAILSKVFNAPPPEPEESAGPPAPATAAGGAAFPVFPGAAAVAGAAAPDELAEPPESLAPLLLEDPVEFPAVFWFPLALDEEDFLSLELFEPVLGSTATA